MKPIMKLDWKTLLKKQKLIFILGGAGILLILLSELSGLFFAGKNPQPLQTRQGQAETYKASLEKQLTDIIGSINGAGKTKVMVTLETGVEYVYANEQSKNSDKSEDMRSEAEKKIEQRDDLTERVILIDGADGRKEALVQTEIQPTVKGVAVVCEGGDQPAVVEEIIRSVTVVLNVSAKRVCVTKLS